MLRTEEKDQIIEANRTQEGSSLQTGSAEDGWSQKKPAELPEEEGCRTVSCLHRKAWDS